MLKNRLFLFFLLYICSIFCYAQQNNDIHGRVTDSDLGKDIKGVSVYAIHLPDSSIVNVVTTNEEGVYSIPFSLKISALKFSNIGYKTLIREVHTGQIDVALEPESHILREFVVTAKSMKHLRNGYSVNVSGAPLSKIGNARDVLRHLPFVSLYGDDIVIKGKGKAQVYIDGRKMQDKNELKTLNSSDIKKVEVITNPGAEYDATYGSVILVKTNRFEKIGFSGKLYNNTIYDNKFSNTGNIDLNFGKGTFNAFASLNSLNLNSKFNQCQDIKYGNWQIENNLDGHTKYNKFQPVVGFNELLDSIHEFGATYEYSYLPSWTWDNVYNVTSYHNENQKLNVKEEDYRNIESKEHRANAYYNIKFCKENIIQLNFDFISGHQSEIQNIVNHYVNSLPSTFDSESGKDYRLYDGKISYTAGLFKGMVNVGGEYIRTTNCQKYLVKDDDCESGLKSNQSEAKQNLYAAFLQYSRSFGLFTASAGCRFEATDFEYLSDGIKDADASKNYTGIFPDFDISYNTDDMQMSLNYKNTTKRPNYKNLRNSISYNNMYMYEGGNPLLKNVNINTLSYSLSYKDWDFMMSYSNKHNNIVMTVDRYKDNDSILFSGMDNVNSYKELLVDCMYSPQIGIWIPRLEVSLLKPFAKYKDDSYNKPIVTLGFNNELTLGNNFIVECDINCSNCGHQHLLKYKNDFCLDIYVSKSFFKDKFRINLNIENVFNTSAERWIMAMNNISFYNVNKSGHRSVSFSITYNFNNYKNKSKAREKNAEIDRLR